MITEHRAERQANARAEGKHMGRAAKLGKPERGDRENF